MTTLQHHAGGCHCGRVRFDVTGTIASALSCNCSICQRKGGLLWFVPREQMQLRTPDDAASSYTFNKHLIRHRFCPTCGIHPYGEGTDPQGRAMAAINLRCLDDIDLAAIPVQHFNGRDM